MNAKKAKKIRRVIGFKPNTAREYKTEHRRVGLTQLSGTVVCTGLRQQYQLAKRVAQRMRIA